MGFRMRRSAGWAAVLVALGLATGCGEGPTAPPPAPSGPDRVAPGPGPAAPRIVILFSIDTLRADHLGLYGYDRFTSPVLDALAREGVVFDDASSVAPWTLPSHASLLTGLYPRRHRVMTFGTALPAGVPTLASILAGHGFTTAAVVATSWLQPEKYGLTRDFEHFRYVETAPDRRTPSTWIIDQAQEWIRQAGDGRLFLFLHSYDVHADYASQPAFERLFVAPYDGEIQGLGWELLRANLEEEYLAWCHANPGDGKCTFGSTERPRVVDQSVQKLVVDEEDVQHIVNLYDAGIRQMDTELSRLLGFLDEQGIADETLLIVTSDHGEEFMDHGRLDHFLPTWQEVLRVPLIMRGPGLPPATRIDAPVASIDVAPTVLALLGIDAPADLDGLDLAPLWRGGDDAPFRRRYLYGEASGGLQYEASLPGMFPVFRSVRQDTHKLVYDSKSQTHALYDLATDPGEQNDVAAEHPEIAERLLAEMRRRYADFTPEPAEGAAVELSADELEKLRALGYVP